MWFGTWALGGADWGPAISPVAARRVLELAWDQGFHRFDSAESYGRGRAELLLGQAFRSILRSRRETIFLAGKSVLRDPPALEKHLEKTLRRIGTDYLDIYYIHWPREGLDLPLAIEALERERQRGRIRAVGVCNVSRSQYRVAAEVCAAAGAPPPVVQTGYNLLWRRDENEVIPEAQHRGAPVLAYSPLAQGLLARPFPLMPNWHRDDHRGNAPLFSQATWPAVQTFNHRFIRICEESDHPPAAIALAWILARGVTPVAGARTEEQVRSLGEVRQSLEEANPLKHTAGLADAVEALYRTVAPVLPVIPNMFDYTPRPVTPPGR